MKYSPRQLTLVICAIAAGLGISATILSDQLAGQAWSLERPEIFWTITVGSVLIFLLIRLLRKQWADNDPNLSIPDITDETHRTQARLLEMLAESRPLPEILTALIRHIEMQEPGMIGTILLADEDGLHLRSGAAPGLPEEYSRLVDGIQISEGAGCCGTAGFRREPVYVEDTLTNPLWEHFRHIAEKFNLRACWSTPFFDSRERLLGTFAVYFRESKKPEPRHLRLLDAASHIAAIATSHVQENVRLRESEARYRALFEATDDGVLVVDRNGKIISYNRRFVELWKLPEQLVTGHDDSLLLQAVLDQLTDPEQFLARVRELYSQPDAASFDQLHFKDGRVFERYSRPKRKDNTIIGRIWSFRCVTARHKIETDLQREQALLREVTDLLPDSLYVKDRNFRFLLANRELARRFGVSDNRELVGQTNADFFAPEVAARLHAFEQRILDGETISNQSETVTTRDGNIRHLLSTKIPLRDKTGNIIGLIGTGRDVTHQRQLEESLRQSQKMEAIGQLAGGVAHDFNNILATIRIASDMLRADGKLDSQQQDTIGEITKATDRAANLSRQLLLFSRRKEPQLINVNLNDCILHFTKMLQRLVGENIQLDFQFDPGLLPIHADISMVDQILLNLVVNARDAMPDNGHIRILTRRTQLNLAEAAAYANGRPGDFARLTVADNGNGIPAEILPHIFEPFYTTKDTGKGTGLGLATVFGVVQQHSGFIHVTSQPGSGTTFDIFLPLLDKTASLAPLTITEPELATMRGGHETILLAEDEPALRRAVTSVLTRLGYQVILAGDAQEALHLWQNKTQPIHLLLTDLVMPGALSGSELARRIQSADSNIKIIYASGYSKEVMSNEIEATEGVNFLAKPFTAPQLAAIVRHRLDH